MRSSCLRGGEMRVILMVMGMAKPQKAFKMGRVEAMAKENMEAIVNLPRRAQQEDAALKDNIIVQARLPARPQQLNLLYDAYCLRYRKCVNMQCCRHRLRQRWHLQVARRLLEHSSWPIQIACTNGGEGC